MFEIFFIHHIEYFHSLLVNIFKKKTKEKKSFRRVEVVNNNQFKKFMVKDKFEINFPMKFDEIKLRNKLFSIKCPPIVLASDGTKSRPKIFHQKFLINCNHWITWLAHMGTSDMPYNYVAKVPSDLAVGQFLMNLRKNYRAFGLPKCYEKFMENEMHYQLKVYKKWHY